MSNDVVISKELRDELIDDVIDLQNGTELNSTLNELYQKEINALRTAPETVSLEGG